MRTTAIVWFRRDLRDTLRERDGELFLRDGRPEGVLPADHVGPDVSARRLPAL